MYENHIRELSKINSRDQVEYNGHLIQTRIEMPEIHMVLI